MLMSRLRLRREGIDVGKLAAEIGGDAYRLHKHLWRLFGDHPDRERDFLFRREEIGVHPGFFVLSGREPRDRSGLWRVETKDYEPRIRDGERLVFSLRANPTVTRRLGPEKRHARHDVVMAEKSRLKEKGTPPGEWPGLPDLVQRAGAAWLSKKGAGHGFEVEEDGIRCDGYHQHRLQKGGGRVIKFSTVDFNGILTVIDAAKFLDTLYHGIGPAKSFGCGLMLVKRR